MRRWRVMLPFQKPPAKRRGAPGFRPAPWPGALPGGSAEGEAAGAANGWVAVKMRLLAPTRTQSEIDAQEVPQSAFLTNCPVSGESASKGTRFSKVQEPGPPVGSVEVRTSASLSTATQLAVVAQVRPVICPEPAALVSAKGAPPAGLVEVRMLPPASPAAQSSVATQETPSRSRGVGEPAACQAEAPPVGSLETKIRPSLATATQSEGVAQETPRRSGALASCVF